MEQRVKKIMSAVLGVPAGNIGPDASPETIEDWDSLKHINLILALEEEFGVSFSDSEIVEMASYPAILERLQAKFKN